jgi:O-antigen/teichoic acid export membrane protein
MTSVRERLVRGLVSGLLHEAFIVVASFGAMLVLVRLLTPQDYGQAAAVSGMLALARAFSGAMFVEHALQHGKETEPDWDRYFAVVGWVQLTLLVITNAIALTLSATEMMASIAPLLHLASLGLLLDWPSQVASVKLRRELRFERLKLISVAAVVVHLTSSIILASLGFGAMSLIVGANVLSAVPMGFMFLVVDRWRPRDRWLFVPRADDTRDMVSFGMQQIAGSILQSIRSAAESVVLTKTFGVTTFGLVNRALALYQSTIGRLSLLFLTTAYPVLPMESADRQRYARRASRFIEAALILGIPGAVFIALEGADVSRVLYGGKWAEANPLLAPAAISLAAATLTSAASSVLLGIGRVRQSVAVEALVPASGLLALIATLFTNAPIYYLWTLAGLQVISAVAGFIAASPLMERDWMLRGLWPALAASVAGIAAVLAVQSAIAVDGLMGLALASVTYTGAGAIVLAFTAKTVVMEVLRTQKTFGWKMPFISQAQVKA